MALMKSRSMSTSNEFVYHGYERRMCGRKEECGQVAEKWRPRYSRSKVPVISHRSGFFPPLPAGEGEGDEFYSCPAFFSTRESCAVSQATSVLRLVLVRRSGAQLPVLTQGFSPYQPQSRVDQPRGK
ncbi:hypothetical protein R6Q59_009951 [Mikania micrantha]